MVNQVIDGSVLVVRNLPRVQSKLGVTAGGCAATTDGLPVGVLNLYFTQALFNAALGLAFPGAFAAALGGLVGGIDGQSDDDDGLDFNSWDYSTSLDANGP